MKRSPFKFLDAYTKQDKNIFFGRKKETAKLYNLLFRSNLILLYGPSGSGKTSLIESGLSNKLNTYDWKFISIRRNSNFNASLLQTLQTVSGDKITTNIKELIAKVNNKYFVTPCLVLDQFEELFTTQDKRTYKNNQQSKKEEQLELIKTIDSLRDSDCKIVISVREEFLAHLDTFEDIIPTIKDFKLRLSNPVDKFTTEIISKSFNEFNINKVHISSDGQKKTSGEINSEEQEFRIEKIIESLKGENKNANIALPFLQVYLDRLYISDFKKTYGIEPDSSSKQYLNHHPIEFDESEIINFGTIEKVLTEYIIELNQTLISSQPSFQKYKSKDTLVTTLRLFTAKKGFKSSIKFRKENEIVYIDDESIKQALEEKIWNNEKYDEVAISKLLQDLDDYRIIKDNGGGHFELSHDILAKIIYDIPTSEDQIYYQKEIFNNSYEIYKNEEPTPNNLLSENHVLLLYEAFRKKKLIDGKDEQELTNKKEFWQKSVDHTRKLRKEEARKDQELVTNKYKTEQAKRQKNRLIIFTILLGLVSLLALYQSSQAKKQTKLAESETERANIQTKLAESETERANIETTKANAKSKRVETLLDTIRANNQVLKSNDIKLRDKLLELNNLNDSIDILNKNLKLKNVYLKTEKDSAIIAKNNAINLQRRAQQAELKATDLKTTADSLRALAQSQVYAFESNKHSNDTLQSYYALKAYYLNELYNQENWSAVITESLNKAYQNYDTNNYTLKSKRDTSNILDFQTIDNTTFIVTAMGRLYLFDISNHSITNEFELPSDFIYKRNSLSIIDDKVTFEDLNNKLFSESIDSLVLIKPTANNSIKLNPRKENLTKSRSNILLQNETPEIVLTESYVEIYSRNFKKTNFDKTKYVTAFSLSKSKDYLAIGFDNGDLLCIDVKMNKILFQGLFHQDGTAISSIDINNDIIATGGFDGHVKINKIDKLQYQQAMSIPHKGWIRKLHLTNNQKVIVAIGNELKVYHLNNQELSSRLCSSITQYFESSKGVYKTKSGLINLSDVNYSKILADKNAMNLLDIYDPDYRKELSVLEQKSGPTNNKEYKTFNLSDLMFIINCLDE